MNKHYLYFLISTCCFVACMDLGIRHLTYDDPNFYGSIKTERLDSNPNPLENILKELDSPTGEWVERQRELAEQAKAKLPYEADKQVRFNK